MEFPVYMEIKFITGFKMLEKVLGEKKRCPTVKIYSS